MMQICFVLNVLKKTKAKENPILWMEGALARLQAEDYVEPLIYNGNATVSLGMVVLQKHNKFVMMNLKSLG